MERMFLCVKIVRDMQERKKHCRTFCGALDVADQVECVLVYVMDKEADCRAQEKQGAAYLVAGAQWWSVKWVSPADKTGGAP